MLLNNSLIGPVKGNKRESSAAIMSRDEKQLVSASSSSSLELSGQIVPARTTRTEVIRGLPSQYVRLNVGGYLFHTTIGTLTKYDSMLR